jgi:tape measure domain-containing protein
MKAGEISIDLTIDDKDFSIKLKNGEQILSRFTKQLDSTASSAKAVENHFGSLSSRFRHFMIMVASTRFALLDINQVFLSLPRSIIQVSGEMERMTKLLEGLSRATTELARKQEALASVNFLYSMAKTAPFQVAALTDAFVKLKSGGLDPMNGSMKALVDSVAKFGGDSQKLHRASIAIQQMAGKGVISMEELRQQLGEAIPNAIEMMAVGAGKSMSKMVAEISKGQVEATSALERMFAVMQFRNEGAAAAMMDTWVGLTERLKTEWILAQVEMGKGGGFDEAKKVIQELIDSFSGAQMRQLGSDLSYVVAQMVKGIGALIQGVQQYYEYIKLAGQAFVAYFVASRIASGGVGIWDRIKKEHAASVREMEKANREQHRNNVKLHEQEVAAARSKYAQIQREANQHVAAMNAAESRLTRINRGASSAIQEARTLEAQARAVDLRTEAGRRLQVELNREAAALRANAAQMQSLTAATVASRNAYAQKASLLRAEASQQAAHIQRLNATVVSMNNLTGAQKAWGTVSRGLGNVFNALGGWITVVSIALAFGISKWMDYAQAAERASQRARDAANGISSAKALADANEELVKNRSKQSELTTGASASSGVLGVTVPNSRKLEELKQRERELNEEIKLHRENLSNDAAAHQERLYNREYERNATALKRHYQQLAVSEEDEIRKKNEALLAVAKTEEEKTKIRAEQQSQIAEVTRRNAMGVAKDILTYNENALRDVNEKLKTATEADRVALEKIRDFHEATIKDARQRLELGQKIGTDYEKLFGSGDGKKKSTALEGLLDRVADKLAVINGELNKKGSGDLQKIISDIEQIDPKEMIANGKRMTKEEVIAMIMPGLIEGEWRLDFEKAFEKISDTVGDEMLRVSTELDGGRTTIERLREELNELGIAAAAAGDPNRVGRVTAMIDRLDELKKAQSKLSFKDLSTDFTEAIEQVRASMSDDPGQSVYAAWSKDIAKFQEKIVAAKLDVTEAAEAQKLFADYVKVTYERLQLDLEPPIMKMAREWQNATQAMSEASVDWANDAAEAITDLVMTGKADFKDLAKSIIRDIVAIQVRAAMGQVIQLVMPGFSIGGQGGLSGLFGGSGGGIMDTLGTASSLYNNFSGGGILSSIAGSSAAYGAALGTTSIGAGSQAAMLAAQTGAFGLQGTSLTAAAASTASGASFTSSLMSGLGTAMPWVAGGLMLANAFGAFKGSTPHRGAAVFSDGGKVFQPKQKQEVFDLFAGGRSAAHQFDTGGYYKDRLQSTADALSPYVQIAGNLFNRAMKLGGDTGTYRVGMGFRADNDDKSKGSFVVLDEDGNEIAGYTTSKHNKNPEKGLASYLAKTGVDLRDVLVDADLPGWIDDVLMDIGDSVSIEQLNAVITSIEQLSGQLETTSPLGKAARSLTEQFADLGVTAPTTIEGFKDLIQSSDELGAELFGLAPAFFEIQNAQKGLYEQLYSDSERYSNHLHEVKEAFAKLDIAMPKTKEELRSLIDAQDASTVAGAELRADLLSLAPAFFEVANAIAEVRESIRKTTADSIRDIEMTLLDDKGKYDFIDKEIVAAVELLQQATNPADIRSLFEEVNSKTMEAWNILSEEQQQAVGRQFIDRLEFAEQIANSRLDESLEQGDDDSAFGTQVAAAAAAQQEAAIAQKEAAVAQKNAADMIASAAAALRNNDSFAADRIVSALSGLSGAMAAMSQSEVGGY